MYPRCCFQFYSVFLLNGRGVKYVWHAILVCFISAVPFALLTDFLPPSSQYFYTYNIFSSPIIFIVFITVFFFDTLLIIFTIS